MPLEYVEEERILVLAPRGRDAQVIEQVLARDVVQCEICVNYRTLLRELDRPTGAALVAEEALLGVDMAPLVAWLSRQASWSDFPFVLLVSQHTSPASAEACSLFKRVGNVVLLERPINAETLRNAAASALRARRRQYQARQDLQELGRSEERLRIAQQAGGIGSFELFPETGKIAPSEQFCRLWGVAVKSEYNVAEFLALIHPDDRKTIATENGRLPPDAPDYTEYRILRADTGETRWMARHGEFVPDGEGGRRRYIGVSYDITLRKRTEQNLRFLAEASDALAMLSDEQTRLDKLANLAVPTFSDWCIVGIQEQDGTFRRLAIAHADPRKVQAAYAFHRRFPIDPDATYGPSKVLRTGQPEMVREITSETLGQLIHDPECRAAVQAFGFKSYLAVPLTVRGKTLGVVTFLSAESTRLYGAEDLALAEDLGRRAAAAIENANLYRSLQESDRGKDIFLATLSHELRNPLAAITNGISVIELAAGDKDKVRRSAKLMERQASQLARLVDDLMDISRITTGKIVLRKQHANLASILNNAIEASRPFIQAENHDLLVNFPDASLDIVADPMRLAQVFSNLISNAAKYTDRGGKIVITVECAPSEFLVRIADTGIGISADRLKSIFVMFAQVSHPLERSQGGLGIGLALVDGLVKLHGGTVDATSAGPGKGSEFTVRLPRDGASAAATNSKAICDRSGDTSTARRVLVVDDNIDAALMLTEALQLLGNEATAVYDGLAAVATVSEMNPDIVLLDIGLPGIDGYEVARRIRAGQKSRDLILIALTGWGQEKDKQRAAAAGFDDHWVKPVHLEQLKGMVARYRDGEPVSPQVG